MKTVIKQNGQVFKLSLVTKDFVFYTDETESDENASVLMYRNNEPFDLVSSNYFAYQGLIEALEEIVKMK